MKQLTFICLTFTILLNCSNKKVSILENNIYAFNNNASFVDSLRQNVIPIIKGVWVLTDYIDDIEKTASPLKSRYKLDGIVTMVIDVSNQSDSIKVDASMNNHEIYDFMIYFQTGENNNSLKTNISDYNEPNNFYELSYETINNVNYLFLYHYDKKNKLIDKMQFSKVADENQDNDAAWGLQYIVNKKLFSGNFTLIDTANKKTKITFNPDGSLIGFSEDKTYHIVTDYLGDYVYQDFDLIDFKNEKRDITCYAFQINKDTIYLYSVIFEEETGLPFKLNELKYKLLRFK